jgi:nitroimidazol reductase NimA-like FMN-containing flavoprotein (pyridoxamine 5'-phosphate oxidase superfamily)
MVAHVGVVEDGWPLVIPMTFHYEDGHVYIHGVPGSRLIRAPAAGAPACVEVTLVDGLIASKSAETHSINYRSVVLFGRGAFVRDRERRWVVLEAISAKGRSGGPRGPFDAEPDAPGNAGVHPVPAAG